MVGSILFFLMAKLMYIVCLYIRQGVLSYKVQTKSCMSQNDFPIPQNVTFFSIKSLSPQRGLHWTLSDILPPASDSTLALPASPTSPAVPSLWSIVVSTF